MNKKGLNERDICTKFIAPALRRSGWDEVLQVREEVRGFHQAKAPLRLTRTARV